MSTSVYIIVYVKPDKVDEMLTFLKELFPETRTKAGCQLIELTQDQEDPSHFVVFEKWDSRQHHEAYVQELIETGKRAQVNAMLAKPLRVFYCDPVEA